MRPIQLILILLFGGLAVCLEFRDIKEWTLFGRTLLDSFAFYALCVLLLVCLIKNIRQYRRNHAVVSFLPSALGFTLLALTIRHNILRSLCGQSSTLFTAANYDLGTDGGFRLHFKKNNYLVGEKIDHFSTTTYWGKYKRSGDTINLDISLNFKMGRLAVIKENTLRFLDDTAKFEISPY